MQYLKRLKLSLTCVCNERCSYCEYTDWKLNKIRFNLKTFKEDINTINKYFKYDEVSFSGGEPGLLNNQILENVFDMFSNKKIEIYTNGLILKNIDLLKKYSKSILSITYHVLSLENLKRDEKKLLELLTKKIHIKFSYIVQTNDDIKKLKLLKTKFKILFRLINLVIHPALNRQLKKHSIKAINEMVKYSVDPVAYHEEFLNDICDLSKTLMYIVEERKFTVCCYSNIHGLLYSINNINKINIGNGCPFENNCLIK